MKTNKIHKAFVIGIMILAAYTSTGCSDETFLDTPPEDSYSMDTFYKTDEEVRASTNHLYGKPWFNYYNKAIWSILEIGAGNSFSYSSDVTSFKSFEVFSTNERIAEAWKSNYAIVAQANTLINHLNNTVSANPNITPSVLNNAIGEARLMRAVAYFNLVRLWGPVPVFTDNLVVANNPQINTIVVEDIYKFIENDLIFASENLESKIRSSNYSGNGHASKGTAKSLLAKVYLYQKKYDLAKTLAKEVIDSGEFKLYGGSSLSDKSYGDLFLTANNNNEESVLAVQWAVTGAYGTANNCNTQFAYSADINAATYGGVFAPSMDLINNTFDNVDKRKKETIMLPGDYYANILSNSGGLTVPSDINAQNTGAGIKKYVVGKAYENTGGADEWGMMANNTYIMRYADVLLIYAEAVLGSGESTSDASALDAFNQVRTRAGLQPVTSFTKLDMLKERRCEFALEGEYWFDLGRYNRAEAISIMAAQNRGDKNWAVYYTPNDSDFLMPYPDAEVAKNPKLLEAPISYNF
ncbi:MAG: RagB/SusD family nutrient uptake outer membrane protein [Bergeyella sp.]